MSSHYDESQSLLATGSAHGRGWRESRPLLICYAPLGDPACPSNLLEIYASAGVDVAEVGHPTPDPFLDGPTIASSMRRVIANSRGASPIPSILASHAATGHTQCRVVLMGYADIPLQDYTGLTKSGVIHGLLLVNPSAVSEPTGTAQWLAETGIARIGFIDAALSHEAIEHARRAAGYVLLQSHDGRTGKRLELDVINRERIVQLRRVGIDLPIALGFGIGTAEQAAAAVSMGADGVVIGSACIEAAMRGDQSLAIFIASVRAAIDEISHFE